MTTMNSLTNATTAATDGECIHNGIAYRFSTLMIIMHNYMKANILTSHDLLLDAESSGGTIDRSLMADVCRRIHYTSNVKFQHHYLIFQEIQARMIDDNSICKYLMSSHNACNSVTFLL